MDNASCKVKIHDWFVRPSNELRYGKQGGFYCQGLLSEWSTRLRVFRVIDLRVEAQNGIWDLYS